MFDFDQSHVRILYNERRLYIKSKVYMYICITCLLCGNFRKFTKSSNPTEEIRFRKVANTQFSRQYKLVNNSLSDIFYMKYLII